MEDNLYWMSFSLDGKNQGCCQIKEASEQKAFNKASMLDLVPKYDDIALFILFEPEPDLEFNRLYTPVELYDLGYESFKGAKDEFIKDIKKREAKRND